MILVYFAQQIDRAFFCEMSMLILNGRGRGGLRSLKFLSDSQLLAHYARVGFCVFDVPNQTVTYDNSAPYVVRTVPVPDGRIIYSTNAEQYLVKVETGTSSHSRSIGTVRYGKPVWYAPGNAILIHPATGNGVVLDATTLQPRADLEWLVQFDPAHNFTSRMHISPSGRWAILFRRYTDDAIRVVELSQPKSTVKVPLPIEHPEFFVFSTDERFVLVWSAFKMYLIDLEMRKLIRDFQACSRKVRDACFTPDSRYILQVSDDRIVRQFDLQTSQVVREYTWDIGKLRAVAVSPDGTLAAAGAVAETGKIIVWDLE